MCMYIKVACVRHEPAETGNGAHSRPLKTRTLKDSTPTSGNSPTSYIADNTLNMDKERVFTWLLGKVRTEDFSEKVPQIVKKLIRAF